MIHLPLRKSNGRAQRPSPTIYVFFIYIQPDVDEDKIYILLFRSRSCHAVANRPAVDGRLPQNLIYP